MVFDGGSGQPITSKLIVASIPAIPNPRVLVEFGTGQQTPITNVSAATYSQQQQALFGIWDWNFSGSTGWNAKMSTQYAAMPTSTTAVAGTGALVQQTITSYSSSTDYRTVSANPICWAGTITAGCSTNTNYGWYLSLPTGYANPNDVDLPTAVQNTAAPTPAVYEQVIYNPVLVDGAFVVNTTIPPTGSLTTCSTTAAGGWTMGIDPSSGGALSTSFFNSTSTNTSVSGLGTGATGSASAINSGGKFYLLVQTPPAPANCTANCPVGGPTTLQVTPPPGTGGDRITWIERR
jgi:type IV pilus assembly protein PilY1